MKIPVKKYIMNSTLSWEERYKELEKHHQEETAWLISEIKRLEPAVVVFNPNTRRSSRRGSEEPGGGRRKSTRGKVAK